MRTITLIIIHCSATPEGKSLSAEACRQDHIRHRGFRDIGYHAGAQVSGVDCFYVISAKVYNGLETFTYTYTFKGLGNAKFELQGEPEVTK